MRTFCRTVSSLLLLFCPLLVRAVTIRVQDPEYMNVRSSPYSFKFTMCPSASSGDPYLDNGNVISADGCFGGLNQSGKAITSVELTFQNTDVVQNSGAFAASSDIFSTSSIEAPRDTKDASAFYTFVFSGNELTQGQSFVITEDGVKDPSEFPEVTLTYTNVTPEPSSLLLLGTGLTAVGCVFSRRLREG